MNTSGKTASCTPSFEACSKRPSALSTLASASRITGVAWIAATRTVGKLTRRAYAAHGRARCSVARRRLGLCGARGGDVDVTRGRNANLSEGVRIRAAERSFIGALKALRAGPLEAPRIAPVFTTVIAALRPGPGTRGVRRRQVLAARMADEVGTDAEAGEHHGDREHRDHLP